ncbi:uncharacterized protein LOC105193607 isoform X2 [Solenopsis invicta]|uniref:uncharacterized protein LOC105193607 isoform X2 n=1 Tax=Solenopsis invicta TaxID=13686 RepID=UPI00193E321B|nr:uncharacterized protein LOC105193607 isoform X2 [Solenopsis invicta]
MQRPIIGHWRKILLLVYSLPLFSYVTLADHMNVQLIAPQYVELGTTATLLCNHTVADDLLHKIEFTKDEKRIFQYIKERNPPYILQHHIDGARLEYSKNGTTIKLHNVRFEASGFYTCEVTMTTPIYTAGADPVQMRVIHPQSEIPRITFKKSVYVVGESLEANCSSSPALPVPYITWFINGEEVDVALVTHFPHKYHTNHLMSATAGLKVEVSALHAGENGHLEISCRATIPDFPMQYEQFADIKTKTVSG